MDFERVLVFCAHPDDEVIGVGGTIAKLASRGAEVTVVGFSQGETGYVKNEMKNRLGKLRVDEAREADKILGIKNRIMLDIPCQEVVNDRNTFQNCVRIIRKCKPEVIFTHFCEDKHRDHRVVSKMTDEARWKSTERCLSDLGEPWYTSHLYYYEIFELFSHPSVVIDVTETMGKKIKAMRVHKTQLEYYPDIVGYLEGLGRARGFLRETRYAESFLESNLLPTLL